MLDHPSPASGAHCSMASNAGTDSAILGEDACRRRGAGRPVYNGFSHAVMLATPQDLARTSRSASRSQRGHRRERTRGSRHRRGEARPRLRGAHGARRRALLPPCANAAARIGRTGCTCAASRASPSCSARCRPPASPTHRSSPARSSAPRPSSPRCSRCSSSPARCMRRRGVDARRRRTLVRETSAAATRSTNSSAQIATRGCGFDDGFVLMTSRASYADRAEAATVGIAAIAALSAPTGMAVRLRRRPPGVTLVGFARPPPQRPTHPHAHALGESPR